MSPHVSNYLLWLWASLALVSTDAIAAVYAQLGVRTAAINVCFVGDPLTSRPHRVQEVLTYIRAFESAANIQFADLGTCPAPTQQPNGDDLYAGDIRVLIPGAVMDANNNDIFFQVDVPGQGCTIRNDPQNPGGSWSNFPSEADQTTACLYNMKLGDDGDAMGIPWRDHTLHEFGHALGLAHEHERSDVASATCSAAGYGGAINDGLLTPYDRNSVMHYQFLSCGINGNYGHAGLSAWDQLALHILYPEDHRVAEFVGTTLVRTTDPLRLQSAWKARGANIGFVAKDFVWQLSGITASTTPDLDVPAVLWLGQTGTYILQLTYRDFLGRTYDYTGSVRVLTPNTYNALIAAPIAARLPLLQ